MVLRDENLNIMIAGRDTVSPISVASIISLHFWLLQTASTITFAIYILATNSTVLARLREEILSKVGPSARPTYDNIRDMKYLRAFINGKLS
jgi:hypothetical protein